MSDVSAEAIMKFRDGNPPTRVLPARIPLSERRSLSVTEVAEIYGVCRASVYNLINAGSLPSSRVLGRRLIPREACEKLFIDSATAAPIASTTAA